MRPTGKVALGGAAFCLAIAFAAGAAQQPVDALRSGFADPPDSAKPRVWWHWVGSNITRGGITKDLEWMKRVGIGGMMMFDGGTAGAQTQLVEHKIVFMTPEWLDTVRYAASEADRLGLEMSMAASAGWSESGGPWVTPVEAMKKVVWSEARATGPGPYTGRLPQPPTNNGPFQDLAARLEGGTVQNGASPDPTYYADTAVLAYPTPTGDVSLADLHPKVTTSGGAIDPTPLFDHDWNTTFKLPIPGDGGPAWIQLEFEQPVAARAVTVGFMTRSFYGSSVPQGQVEASDDGSNFRTLAFLPGEEHNIRVLNLRTLAFPEVSARYYRLVLTGPALGMRGMGRPDDKAASPMARFFRPPPANEYYVTEFELFSGARVNRWENKADFAPLFEFDTLTTPPVAEPARIPAKDVIDLTSKLRKDGTLDWNVPSGNWTILRLGYSLTGHKNGPAVPAGTGYEVDKLNRKYVESYFHGYADPIAKALGPLFGKSLRYFLMDSYEADAQNWTDGLIDDFRTRRGYDPTPYLPVLAGRVVGSADESDRFLWDFRRTVADLFAENHYGEVTKLLHQHGMGLYAEAAGISLPFMEDTLLTKKYVDIPMAEFWVPPSDTWTPPVPATPYLGVDNRQNDYWADVRGAASAAHIYGKPFVAAESFTGGNYESPALLKWIADYWATQGINRFVVHTSAHQPLDTKPGNTMVGTHFNRNITWAELAKPFVTYLSRNMFLLQQGHQVADIAYYTGEGIPATIPYWEKVKPAPPAGYDYDFINTDVLLNQLSVSEGRLVLSSGASYSLLVLPQRNTMTPEVLHKIRDLIEAGAVVLGPKPVRSPSLRDYPKADDEVRSLANSIWGEMDGRTLTEAVYGKGNVYWGLSVNDVLAFRGVSADYRFSSLSADPQIFTIHRRLPDTDIYFVANQRDRPEDIEADFRVTGKNVEFWHSDTGSMEPAVYRFDGHATQVPIHLDRRESVFVVFSGTAASSSRALPQSVNTTVATITGPWTVSFPPNLGAPTQIRMNELEYWTDNAEEGVKFFSGTATYSKQFEAPQSWFRQGANILLDLGTVDDIAEVSINGKPLGIAWKPPYRVDVTGSLKPGSNTLSVRVTNEWTNRIIGDSRLPNDKKILTYAPAAPSPYAALLGGQKLVESGLMGPVTIVLRTRQ